MYRTSSKLAKNLNSAHRIKVGGIMYRVDDVHPNAYDERVIHAHDVAQGEQITIIVNKNMPFKVYILKK